MSAVRKFGHTVDGLVLVDRCIGLLMRGSMLTELLRLLRLKHQLRLHLSVELAGLGRGLDLLDQFVAAEFLHGNDVTIQFDGDWSSDYGWVSMLRLLD